MTRAAATVCLAASPGGHMTELQAGREAFSEVRRRWVTGASHQADALRAAGEEVAVLPSFGRDPPGFRGLPANARSAVRLVRHLRPDLVVTTGAGLVVPFVLAARATGARLVFVESMARVSSASLTGRIVAPFAGRTIVQWPEMSRVYGGAAVCRPALLDWRQVRPAEAGGTFVAVGTRPEPFDRLLRMVDRSVAAGILPRPVTAQSGWSRYRPTAFAATAWMAPEEVARGIESARFVVCHGGAAIVAAAIAAGRRPLVLPRSKAAGEHRTEHQAELVERLATDDAVVRVGEEIGTRELRAAERPRRPPPVGGSPSLVGVLCEEVAGLGAR